MWDFLPSYQQKDKMSELAEQIFPFSKLYSGLADFMWSQRDEWTFKISQSKYRCRQTIKPMFILCAFWFSFLESLMCFCIEMTLLHILRNLSVGSILSCPRSLTETITASASSLICFPSETIEACKARTGSMMSFSAASFIVWPWMPCEGIGCPGQYFCASYISCISWSAA